GSELANGLAGRSHVLHPLARGLALVRINRASQQRGKRDPRFRKRVVRDETRIGQHVQGILVTELNAQTNVRLLRVSELAQLSLRVDTLLARFWIDGDGGRARLGLQLLNAVLKLLHLIAIRLDLALYG